MLASQCAAGTQTAYADDALAFRFKPGGVARGAGGVANDRSLTWTAEDAGAVGVSNSGTGMTFTMNRIDDPLAMYIGDNTDEGEFIEPCLAVEGCAAVVENCNAQDADGEAAGTTTCTLTQTVNEIADDPATTDDETVSAVIGSCAVATGTGTCLHQPAEIQQDGLAPTLGGLYWESGTGSPYEQAMYSDKKIAIGSAHAAFFVFTHADSAAPWAAFLGFRPNNGPGVFAFNLGTYGCTSATADGGDVGCLFTDDWMPSGYMGPGVQAGVTSIGIYRSTLGYNSQGRNGPMTEFAVVTAASQTVSYSGAIYATGLEEYDAEQFETDFDYDWRSAVDGRNAVAAGWPSLGHWALPYAPYFQFRGSIHAFELHSRALSDGETADVVASLIPLYIDTSAAAAEQCTACPAGTSDDDSDPATTCAPCAAGSFSADASVAGACTGACAAGSSITTVGATTDADCTACVAGKYESGGVCTDCAAGKSSTAEGATAESTCVACAANTGSSAGSTACIAGGCTDPRASNYDSAALVDTGLCEYTCGALRASLGITMKGGCVMHDLATSSWKRYDCDANTACGAASDTLFTQLASCTGTCVPEGEHWVVQGRPLAGHTADAPLYAPYGQDTGIQTFDARLVTRYIDLSNGDATTTSRSYAPALSMETGHPCLMDGGCWLDMDHVNLDGNSAEYCGAHASQTDKASDSTSVDTFWASRSSSMKYVTWSNNFAAHNGGATWLGSGGHVIENTIYDSNSVGDQKGGAIFMITNVGVQCVASITATTFSNNVGVEGGAVYVGENTVATMSQVTFIANEALSIGGSICNVNNGALDLTGGTFTGNTARGQAGAVYMSMPVSVKILDSSFSPLETGAGTVYLAGVQAGCSVNPCAAGNSCSYDDYSITCTACPASTYSADGRTCALCPAGQGPNAEQTACAACAAGSSSANGICTVDAAACPAVVACPSPAPSPAPGASAGRRRQLQPIEAAQSLLPYLAPLLVLAGVVARF